MIGRSIRSAAGAAASAYLLASALSAQAQPAAGRHALPADDAPAQAAAPTDPATPALTTMVNPKDGLTYVWIPPGKFMMGCSPGDKLCDSDEVPQREVTIANGFWIGQTLVTQAAYRRVMGKNPSFHQGDEQLPVERVPWGDALRYCTAVGMRIPTEREYEYAARGGNDEARYGDLDAIAWYRGNSGGRTHEVATKLPNGFHLYDMLGNVWEFTSDPYKPEDPIYVAMRGGSWFTSAKSMRVSIRGFDVANRGRTFSGFRCAGD
jgi:formylglycine-generating enzyme required for sulfatase activity